MLQIVETDGLSLDVDNLLLEGASEKTTQVLDRLNVRVAAQDELDCCCIVRIDVESQLLVQWQFTRICLPQYLEICVEFLFFILESLIVDQSVFNVSLQEFFIEAVRKAYRQSARSADIVLYVGKLPFVPQFLFRLPTSKRPRRVRMCGRVLLPNTVDDRVFEIANWNINLSNFDVR